MFGTRDAFDDELFAIEGGNDPGTDGLAAELELCAELMTFLSSLLAFISDKNGNPPDGSGVQLEPFLRFGFVILLALLVLVVLVAVVVGCCLAKGAQMLVLVVDHLAMVEVLMKVLVQYCYFEMNFLYVRLFRSRWWHFWGVRFES